jgi:hypothetical protein
MGILLASIVGAGALYLLLQAFRESRSETLFQLAVMSSIILVPVIAVMMGLDLAQRQMAQMMLETPPQSEVALWAGHALHFASFSVFTISLFIAGITPVLIGFALILENGFPKWIGWLSLCGGFGIVISAGYQAVQGPKYFVINYLSPIFGLLVIVSGIALGIFLWRKADL